MKRKFKQWWSSITTISSKWPINSHLEHTEHKRRPLHVMLEI